MDQFARVAIGCIVVAVGTCGCTCDEPQAKPKPVSAPSAFASAFASASATTAALARAPRPTQPAPKATPLEVTTKDGVDLKASLWEGGSTSDPLVVLVHRLGGARVEWIPLIERIFPPKFPMNVVALDLRGHGESTAGKGTKKLAWQSFKKAAFAKMDEDVEAVVQHFAKAEEGQPRAWVMVGSDFGATLVVRHAARRNGDVAGVGLISPGAGLRGVDIYKPFSSVLDRPNLVVTATRDTVSYTASKALAAMSKSSKLVTLDARAHSAQFLGKERWEMWDELADWVEARLRPKPPTAASATPAVSAAARPASGR